MRRLGLALVLVVAAIVPAALAQEFVWKLPPGVSPPPTPADNPMSEVKVDLGRRLFSDPKLSRDQSMSCGSCHWKHAAFAENRATHPGVDNSAGKRNPPPLANIGYVSPLTWANPHATTLELQALDPVFGEHPVEMGMAGMEAVLVERVSADACYRKLFAEAFPEEAASISLPTIFKAIAAFQRTLVSFDTPYDRMQRGESVDLSERAQAGLKLLEESGCRTCHSGPNFTDLSFHDIGLTPSERDAGLAEKTGRAEDANKFRTPTLRNIWVTGPFMHDGSIDTVTEAILAHTRITNNGAPLQLGEEEAADISIFLENLTDKSFIDISVSERMSARCE